MSLNWGWSLTKNLLSDLQKSNFASFMNKGVPIIDPPVINFCTSWQAECWCICFQDKLLKIVQTLLIQELKQSTLDEIFTLIEPYLKIPEAISREMAVIVLQTALQTFLKHYNFQVLILCPFRY